MQNFAQSLPNNEEAAVWGTEKFRKTLLHNKISMKIKLSQEDSLETREQESLCKIIVMSNKYHVVSLYRASFTVRDHCSKLKRAE